jgi:Restriction Endonuclease associating with ARP
VSAVELSLWTHERVSAECRAAYRDYSLALDRHYADYFAAHPEERGLHPRQARDLERALPPGFEHLADRLPERVRHRHHLSGRSSQLLAVSVLGTSAALDFSHDWLFQALAPMPATDSPLVDPQFEYELPPKALNEQRPRVTAIDYLVQTSKLVICLEAKRGEDGMGRCSCPTGAATVADCSKKVLNRPLYWQAAYELLEMPAREPGKPCPVSLGYQAVRSVAAARHLATGGRKPVFALVYDADNPYFAGSGAWLGWPRVLEQTLGRHEDKLIFRGISWQDLMPRLPLDDATRDWLRVKHRLQ